MHNTDATDFRASLVDRAALPVIDLSALTGGDPAEKQAVIDGIRSACLDNGFFYIVGHGVPAELMAGITREIAALFALDDVAKRDIAARASSGYGYARMGGKGLDGGMQAPVKEEYYCGRADEPDCAEPNQWPRGLPGFQAVMEAYIDALHGLAERLMGAIALSLNLPETYFAEFCDRPLASLRLVKYPAEGAEAGAHTDFGALTFLLQDTTGGLQVFDRVTGGWIHAAPIAGSFLVNLGGLFEIWTDKLYRSTRHRVVHPPGAPRYSAPFFFTGAPNYIVSCLPGFTKPGESPALAPTTPAGHLHDGHVAQGF